MAKYLVAIYRPNDYDNARSGDEAMRRHIDTLNDEMVAAGIRIFVGGLRPTSNAQSIRIQTSGDLLCSTGPHLPTAEYVDGFWVLECVGLDEALAWGRKAAFACRASVEVRPFY